MTVSRDEVAAFQGSRLAELVAHAQASSPNFAARLAQCRAGELPLLTRRTLQSAPDIHCTQVPAEHGKITELRTSGSTGEPVMVRKTAHTAQIWNGLIMRFHEWHHSDYSLTLMAVKASFDEVEFAPDWGRPVSQFAQTGPAIAMPVMRDAGEIYQVAREHRVGDLLIFPNSLAALLRLIRRTGEGLPDLKRLRTVSETLPDNVRSEARELLGLDPIDLYSSNEFGTIAIQCPESGLYHTMDDALIVEVLRADGTACTPGEVGRLVVTDLNNYATPLIRYECGDHAEVAEPCGCPIPFGTLRRIMGRDRNLLLLPDGRRVWPRLGIYQFARDIAPVVQYQVIQHTLHELELRLVVERPLDAAEEAALAGKLCEAIGQPFAVRFSYFADRIPLPPSGKFEEFVCRC